MDLNFIIDKEKFIYSKVISIIPRYVLANYTKYVVAVKQTDCEDVLYFAENQKKQFYFTDHRKP